MKIPYFYLILLLFIGLNACKKETQNKSTLKVEKGDNFILDEINEGTDGHIYCSGAYNQYGGISTSILRKYDKNLKLINEFDLIEMTQSAYLIKPVYIGSKGWILIEQTYGGGLLTLYRCNDKLEITNETIFKFKGVIAYIDQLTVTKNGDLLITSHSGSSLGITRMTSDFSIIWEYKIANEANTQATRQFVVAESPNGDIVYSSTATVVKTPFNANEALVGSLSSAGVKLFQKILHLGIGCVSTFISFSGKNIILGTSTDNYYSVSLINPIDGALIKQEKFASIYRDFIPYSWFGAEKLTQIDRSHFGFFLENTSLSNFTFFRLDGNLEIVNSFPLNLPVYNSRWTINHCYTSRGTMIVGTSYELKKATSFGNQIIDFNLQEITTDGKAVR